MILVGCCWATKQRPTTNCLFRFRLDAFTGVLSGRGCPLLQYPATRYECRMLLHDTSYCLRIRSAGVYARHDPGRGAGKRDEALLVAFGSPRYTLQVNIQISRFMAFEPTLTAAVAVAVVVFAEMFASSHSMFATPRSTFGGRGSDFRSIVL